MTINQIKRSSGFSIVEVMVSAVILLVALLGASEYRYHTTLDAKKAARRAEAARVGLVLCESWRGVDGDETYDPMAHLSGTMTIEVPSVGESGYEEFDYLSSSDPTPADFTELGRYKVESSQGTFYPVLMWKDISSDLRALTVLVYWPPRDVSASEDVYTKVSSYKQFKLTTYTNR
ncbi:MAG: prepilin-type N-terminal cleavage/methylation domain-containing protein [Planctomycetota bacterium]|nr:MAG: prepilin-type N-terminal cleavage/methylation domain-containing protein [Planctomycetota bacterium]